MKKKVGILTYYYNNINFGGQLQAYALQHVLENLNLNQKYLKWNFLFLANYAIIR